MDFRFVEGLFAFMKQTGLLGESDLVAWAGAGKPFLDTKEFEFVKGQIAKSRELHQSVEVHIVQHHDCGGYGGFDGHFADKNAERAFHKGEVDKVRNILQKEFGPEVKVIGYFSDMDDAGNVHVSAME